jgi:hypothetical protein
LANFSVVKQLKYSRPIDLFVGAENLSESEFETWNSNSHLCVRLPAVVAHFPLLKDFSVGLHLVILAKDLPRSHHPFVAVKLHSELEALLHRLDPGSFEKFLMRTKKLTLAK